VDDAAQLRSQLDAALTALAAANARIAELEQQVAKLLAERGRTSSNSNQPPSSDPPSARVQRRLKAKAKRKSGRKRGGQPGHEGAQRALVPPEEVDEVIDHYPSECENCWAALPQTPDPSAVRYQTTEIPPTRPLTSEHRCHSVACLRCFHRTAPSFEVPPAFGPRLSSVVALLTGVYHVSRRGAAKLMADVVGVKMSLGAISTIEKRVSDAVKAAVDEAWAQVKQAAVKHSDGTTWYQSGLARTLWTIATTMATVFKILVDGKADTLEPWFGDKLGVLVSDRGKAFQFWAMEARQICFAHLLRKFISFSERGGRGGEIGKEFLDYVGIMFSYWDEVKRGVLSRDDFRGHMKPLREKFEQALQRGAAANVDHVSGSCADILKHAQALWTFVDRDDVEPTNNHAERELRAFVLWRKRSFGTQSERGNEFAERLMTVAHTARKQNKNVLAFLTACVTAAREGTKAPSLFA
jgi:transposase